jgi:hypothetical protein
MCQALANFLSALRDGNVSLEVLRDELLSAHREIFESSHSDAASSPSDGSPGEPRGSESLPSRDIGISPEKSRREKETVSQP